MTMLTNIDPIRAEIMRLENAQGFDQRAWAKVLIALTGQSCRRADASRRMQTARKNARYFIGVDYGATPDVMAIVRFENRAIVSTETETEVLEVVE